MLSDRVRSSATRSPRNSKQLALSTLVPQILRGVRPLIHFLKSLWFCLATLMSLHHPVRSFTSSLYASLLLLVMRSTIVVGSKLDDDVGVVLGNAIAKSEGGGGVAAHPKRLRPAGEEIQTPAADCMTDSEGPELGNQARGDN